MGTRWKHWEDKGVRKGTGHPTSKADGSGQVSSLTGTPQRTDRIWDLPLPLPFFHRFLAGFPIRPFFNIQTTGEISPVGPIPSPVVTGKIRKIPQLFGPTG